MSTLSLLQGKHRVHLHSNMKVNGQVARADRPCAPMRGLVVQALQRTEIEQVESSGPSSRRAALAALVALPLAAASSNSVAKADGEATPSTYQDREGFKLTVPPGWVQAEGTLSGNSSFSGASGERRTLAWFPANANARDVNVTITITNTSFEFTKLGSFGNIYAFADTLVASQDRSYLLRSPEFVQKREKLQIAKLLDAKDNGDTYVVEYTIEKPPEPERYLLSVVTLVPSRMYNRLYTVTAQCTSAELPKYKKTLKDIASSFQSPPKTA